jgi:murein DD-endopeptidase MepM/ murein hydrolase activator NlpD
VIKRGSFSLSRRRRLPVLALAVAILFVPRAWGQEVDVHWYAETPEQGAFSYVVVQADGPVPDSVQGAIDRIPLQFERFGENQFIALAGVRVNAADTVPVVLRLAYGTGPVATKRYILPVRRRAFAIDRLSVAPEFSQAPDSALRVRIQRESRLANAVSLRALETPRLWRGAFVRPRNSSITSEYGRRREFNGELQSRHLGTDYDGETGDPVLVANRGVVALVADFFYTGKIIYVNHGGGLVTAYMHLSEALVSEGDTVSAGDLIGKVGQSGRVTGPHLHWSAKYGPASLNATTLLGLPSLLDRRDAPTR